MNLSVLYSQELSDFAKILYFEIENLAKKQGFCYASIEYFRQKFPNSKTKKPRSVGEIYKTLAELKEANLIKIDNKNKQISIIKNSPNGEKNSPNGEKNSPNGEKNSPNGEKNSPNGENSIHYMNSEVRTPKFEKENLKENFEIAKNENPNSENSKIENSKIENSKSENFNSLEKITLPAFLDFEVWERFCKYRKETNKPMREMEAVNLFAIWSEWDKDGISVNECILQSMANGWKIVYRLDHAKKRTADLTADEIMQTQNLGFNPDFATESEKALFRYMQEQAEQGKINDKGEIYAITTTR